ncbi:Calmodulin-binding transcription activator 4 [Linum perenne]
MRREQRQDQHSRAFYELSNMVFNLLRSPPTQIPFSDQFAAMPPAAASRRRSPAAAKMTPAGFASLLLGVSLALMLCGSVTFFIGFILMPWVLGLVMVFYVAGIVSMIAMLGRWFLCFAAGPPPHRKDIPVERDTIHFAVLNLCTDLILFLILVSNSSIFIFLSAGSPTPPSGDSAVKGYDIDQLLHEAQFRWLKPVEVFFILQNHEMYKIIQEPPQRPSGGSLFLYDKRKTRFFRKDGHNWRKKKDGRTVGEAHERLKVGNVETLNCYYAHGEDNPNFQRRSYWMLDPARDNIVLVHYREINERKTASGSAVQLSSGASSHLGPSPSSNNTHYQESTPLVSNSYGPYTNSSSPGSTEVTSEVLMKENEGFNTTSNNNVNQYLRKLEVQLSLDEDIVSDLGLFDVDEGSGNQPESSETQTRKQDEPEDAIGRYRSSREYATLQRQSNILLNQNPGNNPSDHPSHMLENASGLEESVDWDDIFGPSSTCIDNKENITSAMKKESVEDYQYLQYLNFSQNNSGKAAVSSPEAQEVKQDRYPMLSNHGQADSRLAFGQHNKFTIRRISPEWGYSNEATRVLIVGSFLCDPSESAWSCMFGDTEVPLHIIQEGVLQCDTPHMPPGKVSVCITSGNRESCSEMGQFEFRSKASSLWASIQMDAKSAEEMLLLVRFVQMLLSDSSLQKLNNEDSGLNQPEILKSDDDSWVQVIEALLIGSGTSSGTVYWLLEQLLKDKLHRWLLSKYRHSDYQDGCPLSKKEQGIMHMVAGLGFEWALTPILSHGVSVDFRDINGWTALHWAARFGREKMVAALIASGASPGAVTDPSSQDPVGKTPASIAAINGHNGLAGYLSELALTTHLSSLTLEVSELSKGTADVEAERTVDSISRANFPASEDQVSIKTTLAAVRNSAQAAARIQSAFRAHSFRRRQQREADVRDEYGIQSGELPGLSALSKMAFGNARDYGSAALSIQKKYRGWRGRKDFLTLRQKVVKIQAHVRGYQVRKHYGVICWAVGIIDKVVLRWRRKGAGLRNLRNQAEPTVEDEEAEEDEEDILKVFRKQKVDGAIDEAVSRVLSMVNSPEARQQYQRMLERYKQAKAELATTSEAGTLDQSTTNEYEMEDDLEQYFYHAKV